jgi:hypothetical protein
MGGTAMLAELPDLASAEAIADGPYNQASLYDSIEVHRWQFGGGRRTSGVRPPHCGSAQALTSDHG